MKKFLKGLIASSLSAMLLVGFVGCSNNNKNEIAQKEGKTVVEFWHYWDGNNGNAINELVNKFNSENKDIEVKTIFVTSDQLMTKLQTAISSNTVPSIAAADISGMAKLRSSGKLLELDKYIQQNNIKVGNFYESLLEYGKQDNKLYSLPVSTNNLALFYNKDLFKEAGLNPENPPKTWEELELYSQKIISKDPTNYGFEFYTQVGDNGEGLTWQLQPYLWQTGADFIKDGKAAFNNENGEKALNFLVKLINEKVSPVGSWDDFAKGKCAMVVDGSWMTGIWKDSVKFDFGTSMIPVPSDNQYATNMGGEQIFAFNKTEKENDAAAKFIAYITSAETQIEWDKKTFFMPIRKDVAENADYLNWIKSTEPRLMPFVEQQKYAHARPSIIEYPAASLEFAKCMEKAYYGKVSVKDALSSAEKAVNSALNN
ncbi:ABC transporter substrate-binding protein [Clostridium sp. C2-6-12]|uniref:ABC transporter substrate-binding protein n=1 Tax=Clostridium sp. C2-6-12 TaxID=2698832 RepID=UPI00136BD48F|nr:ABC transporter substrate-binding protein [Clostridium sp. C2-6-12]